MSIFEHNVKTWLFHHVVVSSHCVLLMWFLSNVNKCQIGSQWVEGHLVPRVSSLPVRVESRPCEQSRLREPEPIRTRTLQFLSCLLTAFLQGSICIVRLSICIWALSRRFSLRKITSCQSSQNVQGSETPNPIWYPGPS